MQVLLVRHGHAGTKRHWRGDDSFRPLDQQGLAEADALALVLAPLNPARVLSSPYLRCVQTITPLAESLGLLVERTPSLVPEAGAAATVLAREVTAAGSGVVVLCTHGETIHEMQALLAGEGPPAFGPTALREKASVWVLERQDGLFVDARHIPPPRIG
jgi:phosphohistidine phosphatase SixA